MTPEQLNELLKPATDHSLYSDNELDAIAAARADLAAIRQPITAEALLADGWVEDYRTEKFGGFVEYRHYLAEVNTTLYGFSAIVNLDGSFKRVADGKNRNIDNVRTMYDLRELVRLMGGAQ